MIEFSYKFDDDEPVRGWHVQGTIHTDSIDEFLKLLKMALLDKLEDESRTPA